MSGMIALEMPREVLHAARMTPGELRRELAIHLFREGMSVTSNASPVTLKWPAVF